MSRGRGFSLIELLVVIAVIAILVAIAMPVLGAARKRGAAVRSLSTMRQLLASLSMYTQDSTDSYPFMGTVGDPFGPILVKGQSVAFQGYFPDQSYCWASLILPDYFDAPASAIEAVPEPSEHGIVRSYYILTQTAFADPAGFASDQATLPEHCRGVRVSDVASPARKGLIVDVSRGIFIAEKATDSMSYYVASADGSAAIRPATIVGSFPCVLPNYSNTSTPILTTRDGVRGLDF